MTSDPTKNDQNGVKAVIKIRGTRWNTIVALQVHLFYVICFGSCSQETQRILKGVFYTPIGSLYGIPTFWLTCMVGKYYIPCTNPMG